MILLWLSDSALLYMVRWLLWSMILIWLSDSALPTTTSYCYDKSASCLRCYKTTNHQSAHHALRYTDGIQAVIPHTTIIQLWIPCQKPSFLYRHRQYGVSDPPPPPPAIFYYWDKSELMKWLCSQCVVIYRLSVFYHTIGIRTVRRIPYAIDPYAHYTMILLSLPGINTPRYL